MTRTGVDALLDALADAGVTDVFGLPGSQTIGLYEGLRRSRLRTILAGSELAAAFMANGYFRASGRTAVVLTIPGPGFAFALPGIAEAFLDSAAVLWITISPAESPGRRFQLQAIDQAAMAAPIVKQVCRVRTAGEIAATVRHALTLASSGEPGPVLLELDASALDAATATAESPAHQAAPTTVASALVADVATRLAGANRVAFFAGAGAAACAIELRALVESLNAAVVTSTSGRGVVPDGHPLLVMPDSGLEGSAAVLNPFFDGCDLIVAIGWKASHNSTNGFRLHLPEDRLVHVDASPEVLGANYPASVSIACDAGVFVRTLRAECDRLPARRSSWTEAELDTWRARAGARMASMREPLIAGGPTSTARDFFAALGRALPATACVVTDSGLHQGLTRRYFEVRSARGLLVPTNFQSMGFGLPAAIGAKLASPERPVVAIMGDGSFLMSGMELTTAVRERLALTIVLFNDESLGLIRLGQLTEFGHAHATALVGLDYAQLAASIGVRHVAFAASQQQSAEDLLRHAFAYEGVTLLEVQLRDSSSMRRAQTVAAARTFAKRSVPAGLMARVRRWTGRS